MCVNFREKTLSKFKLPRRVIGLLVLLLGLAYLCLRDSGFVNITKLGLAGHRLNRELIRETAQRDSLADLEKKLRSDLPLLEKVAREKLGMAREDETVYKFVEPRK